jgi:putative transposase
MVTYPPLEPGKLYHIFNRGNNRENIFREDINYEYFLGKMWKYLLPVSDILLYSLLKNHFHMVVQIKTIEEQLAWTARHPPRLKSKTPPWRQFSNLFNCYAKSFNRMYRRSGSLFQERFRRKEIDSDDYFRKLVTYLHLNPQNHALVEDFRTYPYSSYHELLAGGPTIVNRERTLFFLGGMEEFQELHQSAALGGTPDDDVIFFEDSTI